MKYQSECSLHDKLTRAKTDLYSSFETKKISLQGIS